MVASLQRSRSASAAERLSLSRELAYGALVNSRCPTARGKNPEARKRVRARRLAQWKSPLVVVVLFVVLQRLHGDAGRHGAAETSLACGFRRSPEQPS